MNNITIQNVEDWVSDEHRIITQIREVKRLLKSEACERRVKRFKWMIVKLEEKLDDHREKQPIF